MKQCTRCGEVTPPPTRDYFYKSVTSKDGLRSACKECHKKYDVENRKEYHKKYYEENKTYFKNYNKKWYADRKEEFYKLELSRP